MSHVQTKTGHAPVASMNAFQNLLGTFQIKRADEKLFRPTACGIPVRNQTLQQFGAGH
jgi:hypothetical protein